MSARLAAALACCAACKSDPKPVSLPPPPPPKIEPPLVPIQHDAPAPIPPAPPDAAPDAAAATRAPTWREPLAAAFHGHPPALPAVSGNRVAVYSDDETQVHAPFGVDFYRGSKLEESLPILVADDDGLDWGVGLLEHRGDAITAKLAGFEPWKPAPESLVRVTHAGVNAPYVVDVLGVGGAVVREASIDGYDKGTRQEDEATVPCTYRVHTVRAFVAPGGKRVLVQTRYSTNIDCEVGPDRFEIWRVP